jgi:hypothetical protein
MINKEAMNVLCLKVMALNDSDGGDIGYLYFNNRET